MKAVPGLLYHPGGAQNGLECQLAALLRRQAAADPCGSHSFHHVIEVSRTTAGYTGQDIHLLFFNDRYITNSFEQGHDQLALFFADFLRERDSCGTKPDGGGCIRHRTCNGLLGSKQRLRRVNRKSGNHGDDQLIA